MFQNVFVSRLVVYILCEMQKKSPWLSVFLYLKSKLFSQIVIYYESNYNFKQFFVLYPKSKHLSNLENTTLKIKFSRISSTRKNPEGYIQALAKSCADSCEDPVSHYHDRLVLNNDITHYFEIPSCYFKIPCQYLRIHVFLSYSETVLVIYLLFITTKSHQNQMLKS